MTKEQDLEFDGRAVHLELHPMPPGGKDEWQQTANRWKLKVKANGVTRRFDYWTGSAIRTDEVRPGHALACVVSDAQTAGSGDPNEALQNYLHEFGGGDDNADRRMARALAHQYRDLEALGLTYDLEASELAMFAYNDGEVE